MKVDPKKITKFDRPQADLEWFLLFCISTAGKNAEVQSRKINEMIDRTHNPGIQKRRNLFDSEFSLLHKPI